jgi:hypothetical protein
LILISLCSLWGCEKTKPVKTAAGDVQPAANPDIENSSDADPKAGRIPVKGPAPAAKGAPVNAPKAKTNNDVPHKQETVAPAETKVVPKDDAHEIKPPEMKVANSFDRDPYLASVLKPLVSPPNTLTGAAMGFKNQKQFIAALHLSRNLVIPFDQIKIRVTGNRRMSLSDSLRDIRPSITKNLAKGEVNKAEQQAKDDESRAKDEARRGAAQDKLATNRKS